MIGLIASKTVDALEIGKKFSKPKSPFAESDSETEVNNLLPSNRKRNKMVPKIPVSGDINFGLKCRAFITFLVMLTLVGMVMLISMAALGEFEASKAKASLPIVQPKRDEPAKANREHDVTESIRDYRLPSSLAPQHYALSLNVDSRQQTYTGHVQITFLCKKTTNRIILHSTWHNVNSTYLRIKAISPPEDVILKSVTRDLEKEFFILHLAENLTVGMKYKVDIDFKGNVSNENDRRGLYKMSLEPRKERRRNFFLTNLEPVYARRLFPCFDEPAMRSKFKIKVTHLDSLRSSSTMPVSKSALTENGLREVSFQETPSVPPHLISLIICDIKSTGTVSKEGISINTFSSGVDKNLTEFTNNVTSKAIQLLEKELKTKFPVPKVDIFLVNWQLTNQRIGLGHVILPVIDLSQPLEKLRFLQSLSEQLTKFFFQGVVGPKWWTDRWMLNSLAVFISQHAVLKRLEPGLNLDQFFYLEYTNPAMKRDQHIMGAISFASKLNSTKSIEKVYGRCYEKKGASLIRMLKLFSGAKDFYKAIQTFLKKHSGKSSSAQSFLSSFAKQANVAHFMEAWIREPGYPYVTLKCNQRRLKCYLTQSSFSTINSKSNEWTLASPVWQIPLTFKAPKMRSKLLRVRKRKVTFRMLGHFTWLKANVGQVGLYRVKYDSSIWKQLIREIFHRNSSLGELDRAGLIDDAFWLARANKLPFSIPLSMTSYLRSEKSFVVWKAVLAHFKYLLKLFNGHRNANCIKKFLFGQALHILKSVGWMNNGTLLERMLRPEVLKFAVEVGDKETIQKSKKLFKRILNPKERLNLPFEIKSLIFKTAVEFGGARQLKTMIDLYKSKHSSDKKIYLCAIASSRSFSNIKSFLESMKKPRSISSEALTILEELSSRPGKQKIAWELVKYVMGTDAKRKSLGDKFLLAVGNLVEGVRIGKLAQTALELLSKHKELQPLHQKAKSKIQEADYNLAQIERWILSGKHGIKCH